MVPLPRSTRSSPVRCPSSTTSSTFARRSVAVTVGFVIVLPPPLRDAPAPNVVAHVSGNPTTSSPTPHYEMRRRNLPHRTMPVQRSAPAPTLLYHLDDITRKAPTKFDDGMFARQ